MPTVLHLLLTVYLYLPYLSIYISISLFRLIYQSKYFSHTHTHISFDKCLTRPCFSTHWGQGSPTFRLNASLELSQDLCQQNISQSVAGSNHQGPGAGHLDVKWCLKGSQASRLAMRTGYKHTVHPHQIAYIMMSVVTWNEMYIQSILYIYIDIIHIQYT